MCVGGAGAVDLPEEDPETGFGSKFLGVAGEGDELRATASFMY